MNKIRIEICRIRAVAKKTLLEKNLAKSTMDNVAKIFASKKKSQGSNRKKSKKI